APCLFLFPYFRGPLFYGFLRPGSVDGGFVAFFGFSPGMGRCAGAGNFRGSGTEKMPEVLPARGGREPKGNGGGSCGCPYGGFDPGFMRIPISADLRRDISGPDVYDGDGKPADPVSDRGGGGPDP